MKEGNIVKKFIALVLLSVMFILSLSACSSIKRGYEDAWNEAKKQSENEKTSEQETTEQNAPEESSEEPYVEPSEDPSKSSNPYEITYTNAKTWENSIGTTWVQVIVEITNTGNKNLYLSSGSYDLEDESGALVASQKLVSEYPDVLAPGEKGYMYEETTLDDAVDGVLTVIPHVDVKTAKVDLIRFPVTDVSFKDDDIWGMKMIGRVENDSKETQNMVYVVANLYNANGECIGVLSTIITDDIAAGDQIGFEASALSMPDDVTSDAIADYTIYAYPLQYQFG